MLGGISKPLLASNNMSDAHFPIINDISKMVCRPTISLNYDEIIKIADFHLTINFILEMFCYLELG